MSVKLLPEQEAFATELARRTGLSTKVTRAWVVAEEGGATSSAAQQRARSGNHNWLNIGPGRSYSSPQQGAAAAAKLLNSSGYYKGIRQAIKTGDAGREIQAITDSPWDAGHYRGGGILRQLAGEVGGHVSAPSAKSAPVARAAISTNNSDVDNALLDSLLSGKRKDLLRSAIDVVDAGGGNQNSAAAPASPTQRAPLSSAPATGPSGVGTFEGKKVAAWIIPELEYARAHGWKGTVTSGYRSDAEQTRIYNSGVRPAAKPQSLGGGGSNHSRTGPGQGAIDVSDAPALARILTKKGSALKWAGAKDPVHFSVPHNGSY